MSVPLARLKRLTAWSAPFWRFSLAWPAVVGGKPMMRLSTIWQRAFCRNCQRNWTSTKPFLQCLRYVSLLSMYDYTAHISSCTNACSMFSYMLHTCTSYLCMHCTAKSTPTYNTCTYTLQADEKGQINSLSTVLSQEVDRFNTLLKVLKVCTSKYT